MSIVILYYNKINEQKFRLFDHVVYDERFMMKSKVYSVFSGSIQDPTICTETPELRPLPFNRRTDTTIPIGALFPALTHEMHLQKVQKRYKGWKKVRE